MDSQRNQSTIVGWLGAQVVGEAIEHFVATMETLQRRRELVGDEQGRWKKQSKGKEEWRRLQTFIGRPRKQGEATAAPFPCQREAKTATRVPRTDQKVAGNVARATSTVHQFYRIAICFQIQFTPKFV